MTTSKPELHLPDALLMEWARENALPVILEKAEAMAEEIKRQWPKSIGGKTTDSTELSEIFDIRETTDSKGRPVVFLNIRHPYAAAFQAKTGAVTRAAINQGLDVVRQE